MKSKAHSATSKKWLEACPTLVVACGDSTVEKVIHKCGSELGQESIYRKETCKSVGSLDPLYRALRTCNKKQGLGVGCSVIEKLLGTSQ